MIIDHAVRKYHAVTIVIAGIIENFELQTIVHHNISHLQVCIIIQHCNMQNRAMVHWNCSLKVDLKTCSCGNRDACLEHIGNKKHFGRNIQRHCSKIPPQILFLGCILQYAETYDAVVLQKIYAISIICT